MEADSHHMTTASGESVPGASFARALEDWTKRIEAYVQEIEAQYEIIITRTFAILIFVLLLPLLERLSNEMVINGSGRTEVQIGIIVSMVGVFGLFFFDYSRRLIKLRRLRRNLETLLWPYKKLVTMLSQTLEYGNIDEGNATLIQLKILEAELAYGRARRVISSRTPVHALLSPVGQDANADRLDDSRRDQPPEQASRKR
jgi:hypothetical protein